MIPHAIAAAGWIPFCIVIIVCFLFSALYLCYFWNRRDKDLCSAIVGTLALFLVLLTSLLFPVDIFLVSYTKYANGTFREWATNETRQYLGDSVMIMYYTLYSLMLFFIFFLLPFVYFFYEEKDDGIASPLSTRFCSAFKYSIVFVLTAMTLLLIGAYVPMQYNVPTNITGCEKMEYFFEELITTRGENGFCFILAIMGVIGMASFILYTGFGMAAWPVGMIRGTRSTADEHAEVRKKSEETKDGISFFEERLRNQTLNDRDKHMLAELEETERLIHKQDHYLSQVESSFLYKLRNIIRPLQIVIGIVGCAFGMILWISLLLTNIDRILHATAKTGYNLEKSEICNPLDYVLVKSQKFFPLDYIIFLFMVIFLVVFTISGIQYLGLWFFFLRLYKILHQKTKPQGIILLCGVLMFCVFAINIVMHLVGSQYTMYGSQNYFVPNATEKSSGTILQCNILAPPGECTMSRGSVLLERFIYKIWIFGAIYYWGTWVFLGVCVISFLVVVLGKRYSSIHGLVDTASIDESDDEMIQP